MPAAARASLRAVRIAAHVPADLPLEHFPRVAEIAFRTEHRRGFKSHVHHTVLATRIVARAVLLPLRLLDHFAIGGVVFVGDDVAGALPAARIERRRAPRRALELALA